MVELVLNNIDFVNGKVDGQGRSGQDVLSEILYTLANDCSKMMKLKISEINLNNDEIINHICDSLAYNRNLIFVDLSYGNLTPRQLQLVSHALS